ncbi:hypothetical protein BH683_024595 [Williamsia sp. 1138]|uniref:hypothetical protein n=1 Tax=Williamsia sp. 1138 TaxID=1903117 RepID=UPI000A0FCC23|nr:hypothetical protein [Williamsia sp. 1138]OZG26528.1 hypothetical protein BH683_024595 [Williamsia sp. 1138]
MGNQQDEVYGRGAFQLYGSELQVKISDLLADVFGRDDITCWAGDWRGILYFTLDDEDGVDPQQIFGFDPSTGDSGELATLPELMAAIDRGDIADAVDGTGFATWLAETGNTELAVATCAPTVELEFIGGSPDERVTEPRDVVTHVALAAVIMGRLQALDVQPGDPIPDELFDRSRWE